MTKENQQKNIQEELARAEESLQSADILFGKLLFNDGVSRLYYSIFHLVKALLLSKGLEPKSHEGSLRLSGLHFVKTGILQPSDSHLVARLMKYREEADYNPSYLFTSEDIATFKKEADEFKSKIMQQLGKTLL